MILLASQVTKTQAQERSSNFVFILSKNNKLGLFALNYKIIPKVFHDSQFTHNYYQIHVFTTIDYFSYMSSPDLVIMLDKGTLFIRSDSKRNCPL